MDDVKADMFHLFDKRQFLTTRLPSMNFSRLPMKGEFIYQVDQPSGTEQVYRVEAIIHKSTGPHEVYVEKISKMDLRAIIYEESKDVRTLIAEESQSIRDMILEQAEKSQ